MHCTDALFPYLIYASDASQKPDSFIVSIKIHEKKEVCISQWEGKREKNNDQELEILEKERVFTMADETTAFLNADVTFHTRNSFTWEC